MPGRKLVHLPNKPDALTLEQGLAYLKGGFRGAKLMQEHTIEHIKQLEGWQSGGLYVARLANSTRPDGTWRAWWELGDLWADKILELYPRCRKYQLDNEPNLQGIPPASWRWLMQSALAHLKARLPDGVERDVQLYLAPLAWGPPHWRGVEESWLPEWVKLLPEVYGITVNAYWTKAANVLDGGFGGAPYVFRRHAPHHPQIVGEWGCSKIHTYTKEEQENITPRMLLEIEAEMLASYSRWLAWAHHPDQSYIEASSLFLLEGATPDWRGFEATHSVLDTIRAI